MWACVCSKSCKEFLLCCPFFGIQRTSSVACRAVQKAKLASASLQHAVGSISFHPADPSWLVTLSTSEYQSSTATSDGNTGAVDSSAAGAVQLWCLDKLWSKHELHAVQLQLPAGCVASCHAWAPEVMLAPLLHAALQSTSTHQHPALERWVPTVMIRFQGYSYSSQQV